MSTLEARQQNKTHRARPRPPFEQIALVLQGGGALGAYQAGVYEALAEADLHPDWVAGISIGAIKTALIAGNAPQARVDKLKEFWESVTTPFWQGAERNADQLLPNADVVRSYMNQISAGFALASGAPAFFTPRLSVPWLAPADVRKGARLGPNTCRCALRSPMIPFRPAALIVSYEAESLAPPEVKTTTSLSGCARKGTGEFRLVDRFHETNRIADGA
jgi:hypothetical protein